MFYLFVWSESSISYFLLKLRKKMKVSWSDFKNVRMVVDDTPETFLEQRGDDG